MSHETQFLIAALRRFLGFPSAEADHEIDWAAFMRLADAHAVTPVVALALREASLARAFSEQLRRRHEEIVRQGLAQTAELTRLAEVFDNHRIPFVALKGPILSRYLYGTLGSRASVDVDVLVKPQNVARIRSILAGLNYRLISPLHWDSDSACLRFREKEITFASPSGVAVDVHWRLVPGYYASAFDRLTGWESLQTVSLAGREIRTLAPEPLLLLLCAHGAKHMFERLGWICDIARFLQVTPDLDWQRLIAHCRRTGTLRQLYLGVHLAAQLLGAPAPSFSKDAELDAVARVIVDRLLSGAVPPVPVLESNRYTLRLLETRAHRLRYLAGHYLTPSEAEYRALRLPPPFFFLYYPFRPMRLFWRHVV